MDAEADPPLSHYLHVSRGPGSGRALGLFIGLFISLSRRGLTAVVPEY